MSTYQHQPFPIVFMCGLYIYVCLNTYDTCVFLIYIMMNAYLSRSFYM